PSPTRRSSELGIGWTAIAASTAGRPSRGASIPGGTRGGSGAPEAGGSGCRSREASRPRRERRHLHAVLRRRLLERVRDAQRERVGAGGRDDLDRDREPAARPRGERHGRDPGQGRGAAGGTAEGGAGELVGVAEA